MWIVLVLTVALVGGFVVFLWRSPRGDAGTHPGTPLPTLLEIQPSTASCPAAQALCGRRFTRAEAPVLPLPGCTVPDRCRCAWRTVSERRIGPRRSGVERREAIRFEPDKPPRRGNPGRRKEDKVARSWWG